MICYDGGEGMVCELSWTYLFTTLMPYWITRLSGIRKYFLVRFWLVPSKFLNKYSKSSSALQILCLIFPSLGSRCDVSSCSARCIIITHRNKKTIPWPTLFRVMGRRTENGNSLKPKTFVKICITLQYDTLYTIGACPKRRKKSLTNNSVSSTHNVHCEYWFILYETSETVIAKRLINQVWGY